MDQAYMLRKLVQNKQSLNLGVEKEPAHKSRVIAVSSGKGGVGKTNLSVNLAIALSQMGYRVLIIDADLGMANVNIVLGASAKYNLLNLIRDNVNVEDILAEGPCGVKFLSGGSGIEELANLTAFDLERIISKLNLCENLADIILIDTGAGLSKSVLNFLMAADDVILVTTPEPTAMTDVYAIMKAYSNQPDCSEVKLVVNRVTEPNEGIDVQAKLEKTALRFLNLNVTTLGEIKEDRNLVRAVKAQRPVVLSYPNSDVAKCIKKIASVLISDDTDQVRTKGLGGFLKKVFSFLR
ncbi:MinD/ParA family protein [Anaerosinus gibii]|uniref:MinD/ParA family protein n=1 Tax=Selenobaculum gibii TaxID=3054208 RepID=A0A9Y2EVS3_9FIRM|nr:MinD/ParA family protein [Selenobaculum gbiensis]WIW71599.1 MinD/ParA family protein [Selenobaculum gbiensis]